MSIKEQIAAWPPVPTGPFMIPVYALHDTGLMHLIGRMRALETRLTTATGALRAAANSLHNEIEWGETNDSVSLSV